MLYVSLLCAVCVRTGETEFKLRRPGTQCGLAQAEPSVQGSREGATWATA